MKFSTSLLSTLAPVAMAKAVHNHYSNKRNAELAPLNGLAGFGITREALTEVIVIWVNPGNGAETTTINEQVTVTQTVTVGAGQATAMPGLDVTTTIADGATGTVVGTGATHTVNIGGSGGLVFSPDNVQAAIGDMVIFNFLAQNHSATQSAFDTPCDALAGGMDTGFQPNPDNSIDPAPQVAMQVMVDTPLWFYCAQANHCGKGMTFSINPTAEKTQAMFQAMAIQQRGNGDTAGIVGGQPANGNGTAETTTPADVATATGGVVQGTGTVLPDGACACAVAVGAGSFPAVGAQGIGAFGGVAGSLPVELAEAI